MSLYECGNCPHLYIKWRPATTDVLCSTSKCQNHQHMLCYAVEPLVQCANRCSIFDAKKNSWLSACSSSIWNVSSQSKIARNLRAYSLSNFKSSCKQHMLCRAPGCEMQALFRSNTQKSYSTKWCVLASDLVLQRWVDSRLKWEENCSKTEQSDSAIAIPVLCLWCYVYLRTPQSYGMFKMASL